MPSAAAIAPVSQDRRPILVPLAWALAVTVLAVSVVTLAVGWAHSAVWLAQAVRAGLVMWPSVLAGLGLSAVLLGARGLDASFAILAGSMARTAAVGAAGFAVQGAGSDRAVFWTMLLAGYAAVLAAEVVTAGRVLNPAADPGRERA